MSYLIDKNDQYWYTGYATIGGGLTNQAVGQTFLNPTENLLSHVRLVMSKIGSPTGSAYVKIYAVTGTHGSSATPTGAVLATSDPIDVSLLSGADAYRYFYFVDAYGDNSRLKLQANTVYAIELEYTGGTGANYVDTRTSTYLTHLGNRFRRAAGVYTVVSTSDLAFEVFGSVPPVAPLQLPSEPTNIIEKTYEYKVYDSDGLYYWTLDNVRSEFTYSYEINTVGSELIIEQKKDGYYNDVYLDYYIEVTEFSSYYPSGIVKFYGRVTKIENTYGKNDIGKITVLSMGYELSRIYLAAGQSTVITQTADTSNITASQYFGAWNAAWQTFTAASSFTLAGISVQVSASGTVSPSAGTGAVKIYVYRMNGATPRASTDTLLGTGQYYFNYDFSETSIYITIPGSISITNGTSYYFVYYGVNSYLSVYYSNANPYASGAFYQGDHSIASAPTAIATSDASFKVWQAGGGYTGVYTNHTTQQILEDIMQNALLYESQITLPLESELGGEGFRNPYIDVSAYTFKLQTILQCLNAVMALAPTGWYYFIDVATGVMYYREIADYPEIIITKGVHLDELSIVETNEDIPSTVFVVCGDDGTATNTDIFVEQPSYLDVPINQVLLTDNRVNSTNGGVTVAREIADNYTNNHSSTLYETTVIIKEYTTDINLFTVGRVVSFNGFNDAPDGQLMMIVGIKYRPHQVELRLGSVPYKSQKAYAEVNRSLLLTQTLKAPTTPS